MTDTEQVQATLKRELEALEQGCQELSLQMSLAKADVKSEWERLRQRLELAREELGRVHTQAKVQKLEHDARGLLQELRQAYERIRTRL